MYSINTFCVYLGEPCSNGPSLMTFWDPFHEWFYHRNSNVMEISLCFHPWCSIVITMKFCTWHNNYVVMVCAKFCSDIVPCNDVTIKPIFHRIWITMEKSSLKWAPGQVCFGYEYHNRQWSCIPSKYGRFAGNGAGNVSWYNILLLLSSLCAESIVAIETLGNITKQSSHIWHDEDNVLVLHVLV